MNKLELILDKLNELERFINQQAKYHAFRKYSYPFISAWINEIRQIILR